MQFVHEDVTLRLAYAHVCETQLAALERTAAGHAMAAEDAEAALDAARRYAVEASRDRRAMEILRDRHMAALALVERRAEEAEISEVDATRRRRSPNGMNPALG